MQVASLLFINSGFTINYYKTDKIFSIKDVCNTIKNRYILSTIKALDEIQLYYILI
jgi:hypothetical protein